MIIEQQEFHSKGLSYTIRSAEQRDAEVLSSLRVKLDGETENMDREEGEAYIDAASFRTIIDTDTESPRNLFLVTIVDGKIVGYSRCAGTALRRFFHKIEFGVCVAREFWGYGLGKNLLTKSIAWADQSGIEKMTLSVLATNTKAISIYEKSGFEIEGVLKRDRYHADGNYYDTVVMSRLKDQQSTMVY